MEKWTAEKLREVRLKLGYSQPEFAERINVPVATLRNWEQGRTRWKPITEFVFDAIAGELQRLPT